MTDQARYENDLPSVVEAKDLDAQTAEKLRGSSYSESGSNSGSNYDDSSERSFSGRNSALLKHMDQANATINLDDTEMLYRPNDGEYGIWKKPEHGIRDIAKCLFNRWEDRQEEAKEKLGGHIDSLVPREHRERLKNIHESLVEGNLRGLKDAIRDIPQHQLKDYLKDVNQHLKDSDSDVRMTLTSRGNVLIFSKDNKSAVEVNPRTGETTERAIVGMTKSIPPQMVFGDVEPGDPKEALGRIGDEVTRDTTFGKEDIFNTSPYKPIYEPFKPGWGWDEPIWHRPRWREDEPIFGSPFFRRDDDGDWRKYLMMDSHQLQFEK